MGGTRLQQDREGGPHLLRIVPALTVGQDRPKTYPSNQACVKTHLQMDHNSRVSRQCRDFLTVTTELLLRGRNQVRLDSWSWRWDLEDVA